MANTEQLAILKQGVKVWNAWREQNREIDINLSTANLSEAKLSGIDFYKADLSGAILKEIHLTDANLVGADLYNATLTNAFLDRANLQNADLREANLQRAQLNRTHWRAANCNRTDFRDVVAQGADFSYASLEKVKFNRSFLVEAIFCGTYLAEGDFSQATIGDTIFADSDMSNVIGLENIGYSGPCTIGVDTLFRTKPKLSDIFLRGCGVPEILIEYLPSMHGKAIDLYSCFISYSHADEPFARRLHDTLQGQGIRCYYDKKQMNPGDLISEEIHYGIRVYDKVLLCCSKASLSQSGWVDFEINKALQKERELRSERGKRVLSLIPLNLDGFLFSPDYNDGIGDEIRSRIAPDFTGWEHDNAIFEREVERVIKALRTNGGKEPSPTPRL